MTQIGQSDTTLNNRAYDLRLKKKKSQYCIAVLQNLKLILNNFYEFIIICAN